MSLKNKPVSEKRVAANQANAKHSTGPTTERGKQVSSQNGFKHGFYAQIQPEVMAALHEDPVEKLRILTSLTNYYQPENSSQQMVIDDLTDLRWHRKQVVRSREARMGLTVRDVDRQRERLHLQIGHNVGDVSQAEVLEKGLRNIPDSPGKFVTLIDKFKDLIKQVEECNYSDAVPYLTAIYGKQASWRGAIIFNRFLDLDRLDREREAAFEARRPWPPADDPLYQQGPVPTAGQEGPNGDPRLDEPSELLLHDLNLELRDVQELYRFFVEDKITVTQINRDAAIAPTRESLTAARELEIVDREIAAKIRLFMKMRVKDRKWRLIRQDEEGEESKTSKPAGNAGSGGAQAGPSGARPEAQQDESPDTAEEEVESSGARPEAQQDESPDTAGEEVGSSGARPEADQGPDEVPKTPASPLGSAVGTPLLILLFLLHLVLSLTQGSVPRTPPLPVEAGLSRHLPSLTRESAVGASVLRLFPVPYSLFPSSGGRESAVGTPPLQAPKKR
ncbi:MAG: hypothetical protein ACLQOO_36030 [Terriglobia bacterium]